MKVLLFIPKKIAAFAVWLARKIKAHVKTAIIILLTVILAGQSIALLTGKKKNKDKDGEQQKVQQVDIHISTAGIMRDLPATVSETVGRITGGTFNAQSIGEAVRSFLYSDTVINLLMSISYPLLQGTLINLGMAEFSEEAVLYADGEILAKYLENTPYTCLDKDGARHPLSEVLKNSGKDWEYMNQEVTYTTESGESKTVSLWNSIDWCVTDKDSFYTAINDMSCGLRTVLEVCIQSKKVNVKVNAIKALTGKPATNIEVDALEVSNNGEKTGYENSLVPLFVMLGLEKNEYPTAEEVVGYTELSDIWKALFEPILQAVDKIMTSPIEKAAELLVNFVYSIENGSLRRSLRALKLDGDFTFVATLVKGFKDGEIFNLGDSLIDIIVSLGADITGDFNYLLDSLAKKLTGNESMDLPNVDIKALTDLGTPGEKDGCPYYTVNTEQAVAFLADYITSDGMTAFIKSIVPSLGSAVPVAAPAQTATRTP